MFETVGYFIKEQCRVLTDLEVQPHKPIVDMYRAIQGFGPRKRTKSRQIGKQPDSDWTSTISTLFVDEVILAKTPETNFIEMEIDDDSSTTDYSDDSSVDECNDVIELSDVDIQAFEPTLLTLDAKCYDRIFSWLSLKDLHSVGQTCRELHKIAGEYFQKNYPAAPIRCENDGIYSPMAGQINGFSGFIEKVSIFGSSTTRLRKISSNCNSIKRLHLDITLTGPKIKSIKQTLGKLDVIEIENFEFTDKLFKRFLKQCTNLKRLAVRDIHQKSENKWLRRKYTKLEHFELTPWEVFEMEELKEFFEFNPNIKSFSTNANCLWVNRNLFIGSEVELNDLAIEIDSSITIDIGSFCSLLDALHEQNFYKRLHLYIENVDQNTVRHLAALHALEKLYVVNTTPDTDLSTLINLNELGIHIGSTILNLDTVAKSLNNLHRIYFYYASSDQLLPFIRHSRNLKQIKVRNLESGTHFDDPENILYLPGLNKERGKLSDAQKVIIYLEEDIYLTTKWTTDKTDYDLISIERGESYIWPHHFRHYLH